MNHKLIVGIAFFSFLNGCSEVQSKNQTSVDTSFADTSFVSEGFVTKAPDSLEFVSFAASDTEKLINGDEVDITKFPAILNTTTCSAALIGPRTVVTAAHCIDNTTNQPAPAYSTAILNWFGNPYPLVCKMSADYGNRPHAGAAARGPEDFALCAIAAASIDSLNIPEGSINSNYRFETLDLTATYDKVEQDVTLTGFGCTGLSPYLFLDPEDGFYKYKTNPLTAKYEKPRKLRVGATTLNKVDKTKGIAQSYSKNDGRPVVCPGDSGGPIFAGRIDPIRPDTHSRKIIGVNSETGVTNVYQGGKYPIDWYQHSNFSLISSASFKRMLEDFIIENNIQELCIEGYDGAQNIRRPGDCHI